MKMKLRKFLLLFLPLMFVAPILLCTDTLQFYFPSSTSRNEFVEDVSAFELSVPLKEPLRTSYTRASSGEITRITRQLTEDSAEDETEKSTLSHGSNKQSLDGNAIRQVIDNVHETQVVTGKGTSDKIKSRENGEIHSLHSDGTTEKSLERKEMKQQNGPREKVNTKTEKQNERTVLPDARLRLLKDQLMQGRIYLSLPETRNNAQFIKELRLRIKEVRRAIGDSTNDSELPKNAHEKLKAMEQTLLKGKQIQNDCAAMIKRLRAMLHLSEEQLRVQKKQALFLTHLTAKTTPKGLHCLPLRLSTEYFLLNASQMHFPDKEILDDPKLYHYALFSDNILAAAVVVNSTITHAEDPSKHVFHIVTDRLNYAAMNMWFIANPPSKATIQVQNVEEFTWFNSSYSPILRQLGSSSTNYYFKGRRAESDSGLRYRHPKYLSIMNHLRFYLPHIFPKLDKVLFLDDDIVVQKDLTGLWSTDLKGKVIGVVETCGESFHRFDRYLNFSNPIISKSFDPRACGWAFGMNIVDLNEWRKQNITDVYHKWQNLNRDRLLWKLGTLPPGLITFQNHTHALERSWHVLGLGYNPNVPQKDIERAAVIHYNGNLKPWLEIAIPKFRNYWAKFVDYDQLYLRECNITP
ncbi:probable galacturonosyltransferase 4 [Salvia splendens]|uniref:probable galacturonosyltransferase 4 n=1 Tax=Salvia splendens TaxID=180675 RepID=UPI001C274B12|nr:probable galacturonosyltransferase 4 [Salvia splendens]